MPHVLLGLLAALSCSEGQVTDPDPIELARLSVWPKDATVQLGDSIEFTAFGVSTGGDSVLVDVTWLIEGGGIESVGTGRGRYHPPAVGQFRVAAVTFDSLADASTVTVTQTSVTSVAVAPASVSLSVGQTRQLTATLRDAAGNELTGRTVTWSSAQPGRATVNGTGVVTAVAAGTATITATSEGQSGTATVTVTSGSGSGLYPNEPAGAVVLVDEDADWGNPDPAIWFYVSGKANLATVSDPTAPVNPNVVGRMRYPAGFSGGNSPADIITNRVPPSNWQTIYLAYWFKHSSPWDAHGSGVNKHWFFFLNTSPDQVLYSGIYGSTDAGAYTSDLATEYTTDVSRLTGGTITLNTWHKYEILVTRSANRHQVWLDGTLVIDAVRTLPNTLNPVDMGWSPTWGGVGESKKQTDYLYVNHVRLSYTTN